MRVFNDNLLVEIVKSPWATTEDADERDDPKAGSGIVVAIPAVEDIMYFSNYSWILEDSAFDTDIIKEMLKIMNTLLGKKVYWEKRSELGNVIEIEDKTYATIKLSKIIFVGDK